MAWGGVAAGLVVALTGCRAVPTSELGRLAKPNMVFTDTAVFSYESGLVAQVEPGAAVSGGAAAAGCTSCK